MFIWIIVMFIYIDIYTCYRHYHIFDIPKEWNNPFFLEIQGFQQNGYVSNIPWLLYRREKPQWKHKKWRQTPSCGGLGVTIDPSCPSWTKYIYIYIWCATEKHTHSQSSCHSYPYMISKNHPKPWFLAVLGKIVWGGWGQEANPWPFSQSRKAGGATWESG